jgi:hypothetical protein
MASRHGEQISCNQINLQHSRAATDNLMQIIAQENTDIAMIQETYLYQNSPKGITRGYRTHPRTRKKQSCNCINNTIDALLITQHSDRDTVLLEIQKGNKKFYAASIYMDYNDEIDKS